MVNGAYVSAAAIQFIFHGIYNSAFIKLFVGKRIASPALFPIIFT